MSPGSADEALAVLVVGGEVPQRRADRAPGRVDAGDERRASPCRGRSSPRAAGRRCSRPSRSLMRSSPGRVLALEDLGRQRNWPMPYVSRVAALGVVGELEHVADPSGERVGHLLGDAEDRARSPARGSAGRSPPPRRPARVDEAVDQRRCRGPASSARSSRRARWENHGQQQAPGPGVQRRVRRDRAAARRGGGPRLVGSPDGDDRDLERAEASSVSWAIAVTSA